jgi:uncharacterized protein (DUF736 family)
MGFEQSLNTGSLFVNNNKKHEKSPDYMGSANIGGKIMTVSGWKKNTKNGKTFLSLSFQDKVSDDSDVPF